MNKIKIELLTMNNSALNEDNRIFTCLLSFRIARCYGKLTVLPPFSGTLNRTSDKSRMTALHAIVAIIIFAL